MRPDDMGMLKVFGVILGFFAIMTVMVLVLAPSDPALPEVVYDREGVAYTRDGERIEEDSPLWVCEEMGNRICGTED